MQRGRFITFEGIDGAGKSTQIDVIEATLKARGLEVIRTREPGGTPLGEVIRKELLSVSMDPATETLLFFASRAEHIAQVIRPSIERGAWVLSDRFTDATYAYQVGGRGFPAHKVEELERWTQGELQPDRTVLFDIEPAVAAERVAKARNLDRFEKENLEFFTRVRNAYLTRAKQAPNRFLIVNSMQERETVSDILRKEFSTWA
ncbi:MAG TPA: dTMP kinase [Candidatus Aphodousia faecigallinarum]|uniref:Thymidylate kinase n=1 Tax=Candidatus Aphodousia faecigallinarum TaxID=2840677 RepID=A0A9D1II04_9BURK|nr:dTMP kinase [Candidatus Aphodousia faecigallinarum]